MNTDPQDQKDSAQTPTSPDVSTDPPINAPEPPTTGSQPPVSSPSITPDDPPSTPAEPPVTPDASASTPPDPPVVPNASVDTGANLGTASPYEETNEPNPYTTPGGAPPEKKKRSKAGVIGLVIFLLLFTIPISVYYIQQRQQLADLRGRAQEDGPYPNCDNPCRDGFTWNEKCGLESACTLDPGEDDIACTACDANDMCVRVSTFAEGCTYDPCVEGNPCKPAVCGNNTCDTGESNNTCPEDCGSCLVDGVCASNEPDYCPDCKDDGGSNNTGPWALDCGEIGSECAGFGQCVQGYNSWVCDDKEDGSGTKCVPKVKSYVPELVDNNDAACGNCPWEETNGVCCPTGVDACSNPGANKCIADPFVSECKEWSSACPSGQTHYWAHVLSCADTSCFNDFSGEGCFGTEPTPTPPTDTPRQTPPPENTPPPGSSPTPTSPPVGPQCHNIKVYLDDEEVNPSTLQPNDAVVIAVVHNLGERARIRVNGGAWVESSALNAFGEFRFDFTIPEGISNFVIEAEILSGGVWQ